MKKVYILAVIAISIISLCWLRSNASPERSQKEVVQLFRLNRGALDHLKQQLLTRTNLTAIYSPGQVEVDGKYYYNLDAAPIPKKEIASLITLMRGPKVKSITRCKGELRFAIGGWGFGGEGWRTGLAWSSETPIPGRGLYTPLGEGWYTLLEK